jgi:hypothetical protein
MADSSGSQWKALGEVLPRELAAPRETLHWAAQIVAAAGSSWLERSADDHHTSFTWFDAPAAFAGEPLAGAARALLLVEEFAVSIARGDGSRTDTFPLDGHTFSEGLSWLAAALGRLHREPERPLVPPKYEMTPHPVGEGQAFARPAPAALRELAHWYGNAAQLLRPVAAMPGASPVRAWPHHFDIATLISLDEGRSEHPRSIGVGLSPGDGSYAEPYFYVTPWPYPKGKQTVALPFGHWHKAGWFGAVLTATELLGIATDRQLVSAEEFLRAACAACHGLLSNP